MWWFVAWMLNTLVLCVLVQGWRREHRARVEEGRLHVEECDRLRCIIKLQDLILDLDDSLDDPLDPESSVLNDGIH